MDHIELNALEVPLCGKALIEASAGTGKTFTIATLYIRLLLGHGVKGFPRPLSVTEILVVTFTEAATEELRERIRLRIRETKLAMLRGKSDDPVISTFLKETADKDSAAKALAIAEQQMDQSAIFTIHGFCQRMLRQYSLDTNSMESAKLITDEDKLKLTIVSDFWRNHIVPLSEEVATEVRSCWKTPELLKLDISRYISGSAVTIKADEKNLGKTITEIYEQSVASIKHIKECIKDTLSSSDLAKIILSSDINKRSWTKKRTPERVEEIREWANNPFTGLDTPKSLRSFALSEILEKTKEGGKPPESPIFEKIESFLENHKGMKSELFRIAIKECRQKYRETKGELSLLSFDDLLVNLERALTGKMGEFLSHQIAKQYPFAMIDEFQDTDSLQFTIFDKIYSTINNADPIDVGLFMIGDPKQAIYAFRGADINTYIHAKNTVEHIYTLSKNWRSSHEMVAATNDLFGLSDNPFLYEGDIDFIRTTAAAKPDSSKWFKRGKRMSAVNVFMTDDGEKPVLKSDYESQMAEITADEILELLSSEDSTLINAKHSRKIESGDIAILVRTGKQARTIQNALEQRNISSVYLSSSGSVYDTAEARDLLLILRSLLNLKDERSLRAAMSTRLFGMTAEEIDSHNKSEKLWERLLDEMTVYSRTWKYNGISAAIRKIVTTKELPKQLLGQTGGERVLTNILHLAELLQAEEQSIDSELSIVQTLDHHINNPNPNSDEQQLRLESDENLVKIVTIHKSKGLEYNLVFLPFISSFQETTTPLYFDQRTNAMTLDLENEELSLERAEKERLAEDLRILYVAMTRAVFGTYLGLCPIADGRKTRGPTGVHKTAIGSLVQKNAQADALDFENFTNEWLKKSSTSDWGALPKPEIQSMIHEVSEKLQLSKTTQLKNSIEKGWWITSFSALSRHAHSHSDSVFETASLSAELFEKEETAQGSPEGLNIYTFPRGAEIGTFLHTIFEEIDYTQSTSEGKNLEILVDLMSRNDVDEKWLPTLVKLLGDTLDKPLEDGLSLNMLGDDKKLVEMEFLLPICNLSHDRFNELMSNHEPLYKLGSKLSFDDVKGLLKGFIDLTFEHNGQYFVLDWKSNHLGDDASNYTQEAMGEAIADHRYDVQYTLYTLALHRFLKSKLPNYDYDKHVGGCFYIFLRGIEDSTQNGIYFKKPNRALIESLDEYFASSEA